MDILKQCLEMREYLNEIISESEQVRNTNLRNEVERRDIMRITNNLSSTSYHNGLHAAQILKKIIKELEDSNKK